MSKENFNKSPYFDDHVSSKNFLKILFRPGRPVQTRELNQIQSIFQDQLSKFANHIFKNGSRVSGARAAVTIRDYVRLDSTSPYNNLPVNLSLYEKDISLVGQTSGITAFIDKVIDAINGDPPTLFVVYTGVAIDGETSRFIPGEVIKFYDKNNVLVYSVKVKCPGCANTNDLDNVNPVGRGTVFNIEQGIFYYEGLFIENAAQSLIISKYGEEVNYKIGFDFVQTIITSDEDESLLDNALGYPNSTAPGANRYKVELVLTKRSLLAEDGDNFILLAKIEKNFFHYLKSDSEYSEIMEMIAKRTFETNGNYTVTPFKLRFIEDKAENSSDPNGYSVDGDEDYLRAVVTDGISYVKGFRFENVGSQYIKFPKAREQKKVASFIKRFEERTHIFLKPLIGYSAYPNTPTNSSNIDNTVINVYDGPFNVSNNPTGNLIGSFKVFDVMYKSGVIHSAIPEERAIYKYYIFDINMLSGKTLSMGKSFVDSGGTTGFKAESTDDNVRIYYPNKSELIWKLDKDNIASLRSISESGSQDVPGSISITLRKKLIATLNSEGSYTFNSVTNEYFEPFNAETTIGIIIDSDEGTGIARLIDLTGKMTVGITSITVNLGTTINVGTKNLSTPGKTICILHNVRRTNAQEDKKTISVSSKTNVSPTLSSISLGKTDVINIDSVIQYKPGYPEELDITENFILDKKIKDTAYYESTITQKTGISLPSDGSLRWKINFTYFDHDNSLGLGYYTIDSYNAMINSNEISYEDQLTYTSINKTDYPLFGSFDFRPTYVNGNLVSYSVPAINSTAEFDITYYLGRIDLLCVNKTGMLFIQPGYPSESPIPPKLPDDSMALYEIHLKPYTYSVDDIKVKFIENKRYTMRDIGKLEQRIKTLEYYTVLNVLEKSAADMSIKDENGLDRFKNGFVADNFRDYQSADLTSTDFRACLDRKNRELRPSYTARNKKLKAITNESNAKFIGKMAMIDYDSVVIDEQPFATKHISINPYFQFKKMGEMVLIPNNDVWADITRQPDLVVNIDTGVDALRKVAKKAGLLNGVEWGAWSEVNRTTQQGDIRTITADKVAFHPDLDGLQVQVSVAKTVITKTRTGTGTTIESREDSYGLGDRVTDVSINPFMRQIEIIFVATKMKPNSKVYAFFDGKSVKEFVKPVNGNYGDQLITDASGQLLGIFWCPSGIFHTGDRSLYLTSDQTNSGDPDLEFTAAQATFFSGGLNVSKQQTILNVATPVFSTQQVSQTTTETIASGEVIGTEAGYIPCPICNAWRKGKNELNISLLCSAGCSDPVAQSFKLPSSRFITEIDLFFQAIDSNNDEIFVQIRNMVNGYPGQTVLGEKRIWTSDLLVSEDSTIPTRIKFKFPIYVEGNTEYCFIVGGFNPDTRIWVSKLGQVVANNPSQIVQTQPSIGSSFRSQNGSTWNAEQYEDIKYTLYGAKFKSRNMSLKMVHIPEVITLDRDPLEGAIGSNKIRVHCLDHGLLPNDKFSLSILEDEWIQVNTTSGQLRVGQKIRKLDNSFTAIISDFKTDQIKTEIKMKDKKGTFNIGDTWICDAMDWNVHDNYLIQDMGYISDYVSPQGVVRYNQVQGTFITKYNQLLLNGIPQSEIDKQLIVLETDSMDSFIFQVESGTIISNGRFGGENISITINEKFEVFNASGAYLPYNCVEEWYYRGIGHNPINSIFSSQNYQVMESKKITVNNDMFLGQPHKIVSIDNKGNDDSRLATITASFIAPDEWSSPVVNTDSFSITTISNRVEWITDETFNVEPNAIGRYKPESDPMNGSENYKYVTKTVNLKNPASDLVIAYDVYKDMYADYDVWVKFVEPYEGVDIDSKYWSKIVGINKTYHSVDLSNRIEYEITLSDQLISLDVYTGLNTYTNKSWDEYIESFSAFKVKLVAKAKNPAKPPLFQSFRAIAVT